MRQNSEKYIFELSVSLMENNLTTESLGLSRGEFSITLLHKQISTVV